MLSRVTAALSRFLAPVSISSGVKGSADTDSYAFKRFSQNKKKKESKPANEESNSSSGESPEDIADASQSDLKSSVAPKSTESNLTQLFSSFEIHRKLMNRWFGARVYPNAANEQKTAGKLRKGVILDYKAD